MEKPIELFESKKLVTIAAPMVRYSKLAFRRLVRKYGCDLCFTPMIIADSFVKSNHARNSDFSYSKDDRPLIVQFAANNAETFAAASQLVYPYCDGVDLNCGCPQRWALQEGYGACLINDPQTVSEVVRQTRNAIPDRDFTVSIKVRTHKDVRKSVDFARQMEAAGLSFLTVHGRTKEERCEPVNTEAIALIKSSLRIPVIANGDIRSLEDAVAMQDLTQVDGVMSARGLLSNPCLFAGEESTTLECVESWVRLSIETGSSFTCFHNHLIYMMEKSQSRADRRFFNSLASVPSVVGFLRQKYKLQF
ncbi:UNVERIFIED_CONTAM: hypothetical protein GTU68_039685 [Idotea baltica]|nr:hypothetical protein [Idotea baltica]